MKKKNSKRETRETSQEEVAKMIGKENMEKRLDNLDIYSPNCLADKDSYKFRGLANFEEMTEAPYGTIPLIYIGEDPISDTREDRKLYAMNSPYNSIMKELPFMRTFDAYFKDICKISNEENPTAFNIEKILKERLYDRGKYLMDVYISRCMSLATNLAINFVTNANKSGSKSFETFDPEFVEGVCNIINDGLKELLPRKKRFIVGEKSYIDDILTKKDEEQDEQIIHQFVKNAVFDVEYSFVRTEEIKNEVILRVYNFTEGLIIKRLTNLYNIAHHNEKMAERFPDDKEFRNYSYSESTFDMDMEFCSEMNKLFFAFNTLRLNVEFAIYTLRSEVGYYINQLDYVYIANNPSYDDIDSIFGLECKDED